MLFLAGDSAADYKEIKLGLGELTKSSIALALEVNESTINAKYSELGISET